MPNDIVLPGISALSAPGVYVNLLFGQGQSGAPIQPYSVVFLGNMTSQGDGYANELYGPDTLVTLQTSNDAVSLFGAGSPCALAFAAFRALNQTTPFYVMPVTADSGTAASQTITVSVGSGQTSGVVQYRCDGKLPVQATFASTDSASTIATSLASAINSNVNLPVTAVASNNTVIISAKVLGGRWNNLLGFAQVVAGSGVSVDVRTPTRFSGGAGSDAAGYTSALAAIALTGRRFYYYVPEAGCDLIDGTNNGITALVQAQIDNLSEPAAGLRQRAIFGSTDTLGHTIAAASSGGTTSLDDPRLEVIWQNQQDLMPSELACTWAAAVTFIETSPLTAAGVNFDAFGNDPGSQPLWHVPAPLSGVAPSATDIQTAIISGVSPLKVGPGNTTSVVQRVTTRFFSLVNSQQVLDLRIQDAGIVTICDRFFDDLSNLLALRFPRKMIGQDPQNGAPPAPPGVVTVSKVTSVCVEVIVNYASAGLIDGLATQKGLIVQQNQSDPSSFGIAVPLFNNALAHRFLIAGAQVGPVVL